MAKKEKAGSGKLKGPLYTGGKNMGEVHGPKGGKNTPDPLGYCKEGER